MNCLIQQFHAEVRRVSTEPGGIPYYVEKFLLGKGRIWANTIFALYRKEAGQTLLSCVMARKTPPILLSGSRKKALILFY